MDKLTQRKWLLNGIHERQEYGMRILSPANANPRRRVVYVNSYGGSVRWEEIKAGRMPAHHLYGCLELVKMGYEIAIAEPITDFYWRRRPIPHDLGLLKVANAWLGSEGIMYCGHNTLYWIPLLRALGIVKCKVVSLIFAREPLNWCNSHSGIIALTPPAAEHAHKLAPSVKVAHLGWGCDLDFFPPLPYQPEYFLSCGLTNRDHATLATAAKMTRQPIRLVCPKPPPDLVWSENVTHIGSDMNNLLTPRDLVETHHPGSKAGLIILRYDPVEYTAVGFTEMIEQMAMSRPVIVSRTGALPAELDVEKAGCGFHVPPSDPAALAAAIDAIASDPAAAAEMGRKGRALAETHYNTDRYSRDLHSFFESL